MNPRGWHVTSKGKSCVLQKWSYNCKYCWNIQKVNNYNNFLTFHKIILLAEKGFLKDHA